MYPRQDEADRLISIKANLSSVVLQSSGHKSHLFNLVDTPGHSNFCDEVVAALSLVDGCLLVVDSVEGVLMTAQTQIREAVRAGCRVALVVNKVRVCVVCVCIYIYMVVYMSALEFPCCPPHLSHLARPCRPRRTRLTHPPHLTLLTHLPYQTGGPPHPRAEAAAHRRLF